MSVILFTKFKKLRIITVFLLICILIKSLFCLLFILIKQMWLFSKLLAYVLCFNVLRSCLNMGFVWFFFCGESCVSLVHFFRLVLDCHVQLFFNYNWHHVIKIEIFSRHFYIIYKRNVDQNLLIKIYIKKFWYEQNTKIFAFGNSKWTES